MMKPQKDEIQNNVSKTTHADFAICLHCEPCGGICPFLQNSVKFVIDYNRKRVLELQFDKSFAICNGECGKTCITTLNLAEALKEHKQRNNKL